MKLVVVHDFANASLGAGATRCAIDGATAMARRGVEVTFFAAAGQADEELLGAGVRVVTLEQSDIRRDTNRGASFLRGLWNGAAANALQTLVDDAALSETVFHVHSWSKALSPSVLQVLLKPGVKSVFHLHEYFMACPNGGFFDYQAMQICHRRPLGLSCLTTNCDSRSMAHKAWRVARHGAMAAAARYPARARNFILLSDLQRGVLGPYLPEDASLFLMRNPVEIDQLPLEPRAADAKFLFVGRVSQEKGLGVLAGAFRERARDLVVIGDGPELEWLKDALPDADFRGWQSSAVVKAEMRRAKALVFPSLWYEGMPMVVVEALANGLPVITSDACSAREIVSDGQTGSVFASGNADALGAALALFDDQAHVTTLSSSAYHRYWSDPFSIDRYVNEIAKVYDHVLLDAGRRNGQVHS